MNQMGKKPILSLMAAAGVLAGCSFLAREEDQAPRAGGFRATAAVTNNAAALPVEIADDIARITEDGAIERSDGSAPLKTNAAPSSAGSTSAKAQAGVEIEQTKETTDAATLESGKLEGVINDQGPSRARKKGGKSQKYTVKRGDTLMKIAFQKYGDLMRWKDIYEDNRELLSNHEKLAVGTILVVHGVEYVVIEKNGEPYLIRRRDTLAKISGKLYGTPSDWRKIWRNNPKLIRNPNKIYAGFTLYYQPKDLLRPFPKTRQPTSKENL